MRTTQKVPSLHQHVQPPCRGQWYSLEYKSAVMTWIVREVPRTTGRHVWRSEIMPIVMLVLTCLGSISMLALAHIATLQV